MQPHLKLKEGEIYENVIIPGDPARVLKIAEYLENSKKIQYNREFLTYNGEYNNLNISVVSTGIGCPSALIAMEELSNIGAKNFIRIGTCGGLKKEMKSGDIIIPTKAVKPDGELLGKNMKEEPIEADKLITEALINAAEKLNVKYYTGTNRTHDSFYESTEEFLKLKGKGYVSSEMECAAVFLAAKIKNLKGGCILVVNTLEDPEEVEKDPDIVYKLSDEEAVKKGMDNAIKISLEALKNLN